MNIFDLPKAVPDEVVTILAENENVRIERIVSTGQTTGWYDQCETEFVVLLEGSAKVEFKNGDIIALSKGDSIIIKPHEKHRVCYTSSLPPCVWLCVFY